jgi:hypothetical protein
MTGGLVNFELSVFGKKDNESDYLKIHMEQNKVRLMAVDLVRFRKDKGGLVVFFILGRCSSLQVCA